MPLVMAGMSFDVSISSIRFKSSPMLGIVRMQKFSLCLYPEVKQVYASCGAKAAISERSLILRIQVSIFSFMYSFRYISEPIAAPRSFWPLVVILMLVPLKILCASSRYLGLTITHVCFCFVL